MDEWTFIGYVIGEDGQPVRLWAHTAYAACHAIVREEDRFEHKSWCEEVIRR